MHIHFILKENIAMRYESGEMEMQAVIFFDRGIFHK